MSNLKQKYSHLDTFFTHFTVMADTKEADTISEIILTYFQETPLTDIEATVAELELLIIEDLPEVELAKIVLQLGCHISIDNGDWQPSKHTYKEWLLDLRDILQNEVNRRGKTE
jgi:hypothetical protein